VKVISKRLNISDTFSVYGCNLDLDGASTVDKNKYHVEMKEIKESHQNEILKLKENHRRDILDLQDKTLKWIMSKSDQMQQHSRLLEVMREEISTLKYNYIDLKTTAKGAFVEAQV
jgi:hypothetical protein